MSKSIVSRADILFLFSVDNTASGLHFYEFALALRVSKHSPLFNVIIAHAP